MRHLITAAVILLVMTAPLSAGDLSIYNGTWFNPAPTPQAVTKLEINTDSQVLVHAYGQLRPKKDYDWGSKYADCHGDDRLFVSYRNSSWRRLLIISLSGNTLIVKTQTHFIDNSGRPNREDTDRLRRSLQPETQTTPTPMDPAHPKPIGNTTPTGKY